MSDESTYKKFKQDFTGATKEQILEAAFVFYNDVKKYQEFSKQQQEISIELAKALKVAIAKR